MLRQIVLQLNVELDQAEHGNGDANTLKDLHPDVRECWTQAVLAVDIVHLRQNGHNREEDPDKAVLEDADPDDL